MSCYELIFSPSSRAIAPAADIFPTRDVRPLPLQVFFFFLNKKTQEEQETREGQESTTKATAEITTEEVQRENSIAFPAFLLAARGLSLPPIGSKIALGFYKEQKASPPVDLS